MAQLVMSGETAASEVTEKDIALKPWKYVGYSFFTRAIATSRNFFYVRQFRTLNVRVILAMQDQIAVLEAKLNDLDNENSCKGGDDIHNGTFRKESVRKRLNLIWEIKRRLKDYNEYISIYAQIGSRETVAAKDIQSLENWKATYPTAIRDEELGYLEAGDDLIYVAPRPESRLRPVSQMLSASLGWFRRQPTDQRGYNPQMISLVEDQRAEKVMNRATVLIGLLMLVGPFWILEFVHGPLQRLGVITSFIFLFIALLLFATTANPFESLAGVAGYSAVLIVFLQLGPIT